jgi:alpha-mannosidase
MARTIYLVPHTHYDVVWAFNRQDYLFIFISILNKAVRMVKEKGFRFLIEQTCPLEEIEHRNPELFSELEELIRAGKIEMVDSQYLMADPMIPGGEVLVREILHGKRYVKKHFDVDVPVVWAADGFGLNAQLPQIYRKSGYKWLAFRRGLPKAIGTKVSEFLWEGLDGTKIVSHWMPLGYRAGLVLDKWQDSYDQLQKLATTDHVLMPCGSGGAIPQEEIPDKVAEWNRKHQNARMIMATPGDFFKALDKADKELITYQGEMYSDDLESIFPDVSSSRIRLRLAIRECELKLLIAEKAATLALLHGRQYPSMAMMDMWQKKMFLAMHDVVPGCGIDEIYNDAWEYIEDIRETVPSIIRVSLNHLMSGRERGIRLVVFNPNNWEVTNWVEADIELGEGWSNEPGIAWNGKEVPSEAIEVKRWDDGSVRRARIGFMGTVPALGCRVYSVVKKSKSFRSRNAVRQNQVDTKFFKVAVDKQTGIVTVRDTDGNTLLTGNEVIIDEEIGDLYYHKSLLEKPIGAEGGGGLHFGVFRPEEFQIHRGPVRTTIIFRDSFYCLRWPYYLIEKYEPLLYRHKTVEVTKKIMVYNKLPRIDFETHLNLLQSHVRIRLKFDTAMVAPQYSRQTQFGVLTFPVERTLHDSMTIPSLSWINCQEDNRGLAFLTQGVPINEIKGGEIYCTLLRSVSVLSADGISGPLVPTPEAQEPGEHSYRYSIYFYNGDWRDAEIHRRGFETSQPLWAHQVDHDPGSKEFRSVVLEPDNLIVSALKKAEDDNAIIMRFFETRGEECTATLKLAAGIKSVKTVNLLEQEEEKITIKAGKVKMKVRPFEIVTLKLQHA